MRSPEDELDAIRQAGLWRSLRPVGQVNGVQLTTEGRTTLNFCSNDYLGLSRHPALTEAACEATKRHGTSAGSSRLLCGSLPPHHELEELIASLKQCEAALSFSSGYACALGTLTTLARKGDLLILDKLCHASLVDGARLSGATLRVFPHNGLDKLARLLRAGRDSIGPDGRIIVVTESVFSMDGDLCRLPEIIALKEEVGALLLLDEAHAIGVLGPHGMGLAEQLGVQDRIDLQLGTLGKGAGAAGGYLAASRATIDLLINQARSFVYSTAPMPAQAAAATVGLRIISSPEGAALRTRLWDRLREFSGQTGTALPTSAILPIPCGTNASALAAADTLRSAGFLVPAIRFPTVPRGQARLRLSLSAAHEPDELRALTSALNALHNPGSARTGSTFPQP